MKNENLLIKRKIFWIWEYDKEEEWLNRMSHEGWHLVKVGFCKYYFVKDASKKYTYRLDYPAQSKSEDVKDYMSFYENSGCEYIDRLLGWYYFRMEDGGNGKFEIYTDSTSKRAFYKRVNITILIIALLNIFSAFTNLMMFIRDNEINSFNLFYKNTGFFFLSVFQYSVIALLLFAYYKINRKMKKLTK